LARYSTVRSLIHMLDDDLGGSGKLATVRVAVLNGRSHYPALANTA
jgi:hypothetical protein